MASSPLRLGIAGITGRLGKLCAEQAAADPRFTLEGGLSRHGDSQKKIFSDPAHLAKSCDVILDVSHASLTEIYARAFQDCGVAWVNGVTGLSPEQQKILENTALHIPVLQAANFSPALSVFLETASALAAELPDYDAEIIETHHRDKADAPSGTALAIGRAVARGRETALPPQKGPSPREGKRVLGSINFSSIRGGHVTGEHELRFLGDDEELTLSHRAFDRRLFASGALKAAFWLGKKRPRPEKIYGMEDMLKS